MNVILRVEKTIIFSSWFLVDLDKQKNKNVWEAVFKERFLREKTFLRKSVSKRFFNR